MRRLWLRFRQSGQAVVEWVMIFPMLVFFSVACFQFAVILWAYISVMNVTRDSVRWLVVHPHTLDSTAIAAFNTRLPSNLTAANLAYTITPACTSLTNGKCSSRPMGAQLSVAISYNVSPHLFLPATFGAPPLRIQIPTTLPTYTIYMPVEPAT